VHFYFFGGFGVVTQHYKMAATPRKKISFKDDPSTPAKLVKHNPTAEMTPETRRRTLSMVNMPDAIDASTAEDPYIVHAAKILTQVSPCQLDKGMRIF
jgi:hypothetical protein